MTTFSQDELLRALQQARPDAEETPNSITTTEVQRACGVGPDRARKMVRQAVDEGVLQPAQIYRTNMAGFRQRVVGYVLRE